MSTAIKFPSEKEMEVFLHLNDWTRDEANVWWSKDRNLGRWMITSNAYLVQIGMGDKVKIIC